MKLKFKKQQYQTDAVQSVVDCFKGQPNSSGRKYQVDQGQEAAGQVELYSTFDGTGFKNSDLLIDPLENIQAVQKAQNLEVSQAKVRHKSPCRVNLDVEMETGTGKTYVYIKTMFELYKQYGWSKFIIVVPSIAIREGIHKSLEITAEHFLDEYSKRIKFFIYNSKSLHDIESFSADSGINVMIINSQAFASAPAPDATFTTINNQKNKIYREMDQFQSRRPIDVIKANKPILILDEPQKLEGKINAPSKTIEALKEFNPLFVLRYSATHKINYNKVHRLDALDAYNQKLVKKINVRGITKKGAGGISAHLHLKLVEVSKAKPPVANLEIEVKQGNGINEVVRKVNVSDDLYVLSNELEAYKEGFVVSEIDARTNTVAFINGVVIEAGRADGGLDDTVLRRIQIRETIRAHFEKEKQLFSKGIKVLSLFFIDEVVKYRDYEAEDDKGEYAKIFEEEYNNYLTAPELEFDQSYQKYLENIDAGKTHNGYFSVDKKGKSVDSKVTARGENAGTTNDVDAYDLILKDKERLLSFEEPTRFIFSHSALREGWDNPNVFVICTLKQSDNTVTKRQEVGRGLRIAVNQFGERQDNPATVHTTNVLTVIANESYKSFVDELQNEISTSLSARPKVANAEYFKDKVMQTAHGEKIVTVDMAQGIEDYLRENGYVNRSRNIQQKYHDAVSNGELASLPDDLIKYQEQIFKLVDSVFSESQLPEIGNDRASKTNALNNNFFKQEFKDLWNRMNTKAVYQVDFNSDELIDKSVVALDQELRVTPIHYVIEQGTQNDGIADEDLERGTSFAEERLDTEYVTNVHSTVEYDLIGKIVESVQLTRLTVASILTKIDSNVFDLFKQNPEEFISNAIKLINEQKATTVVEQLTYDSLNEKHGVEIFTDSVERLNPSTAGEKLNKHVFDYAVTDSTTERKFVQKLDISSEVVVYSKLPRGFSIPTPVGNYNPDWAIAFRQGTVKHIYFVAETKGSMSSMQLREIEKTKIKCARKFFHEMKNRIDDGSVNYGVADSYESLMQVVNQ